MCRPAGGVSPPAGTSVTAASKSQYISHRVQPRLFADEELGSRQGAVGVAVAGVVANGQVDRLSQHAKDNRVLADVVADPQGVVPDLAARARAGAAMSAVHVLGLS